MFVLGLEKNIISLAVLEDHGSDVIFSKEKTFLRHIDKVEVKQIRVRVKKLYKLHVEDCTTLITKAKKVQGCNISEIWHLRLGHLHHGTSKIIQQIIIGLPRGALEQQYVCKGCTLGK